MKVLIVEDDPNLRLLWRNILVNRGDDVTVAKDAPSAAVALQLGGIDVVILDFYLGRDDCALLLRQAGETSPACKVVIVTGSALLPRQELFDMSPLVSSVHCKPVDIEEMQAALDQLGDAAGRVTERVPEGWSRRAI